MQEQSPPKTSTETGQGQAPAAGLECDMDEDWEELAAKIRRSGAGRQRSRHKQEDEEMPSCARRPRRTKGRQRLQGGERRGDFRLESASSYDEECQPKVYDELTGHEGVLKARMNEVEVSPTWESGRLHLVRNVLPGQGVVHRRQGGRQERGLQVEERGDGD